MFMKNKRKLICHKHSTRNLAYDIFSIFKIHALLYLYCHIYCGKATAQKSIKSEALLVLNHRVDNCKLKNVLFMV